MTKTYKPSEAVSANYIRGLVLKNKWGRGHSNDDLKKEELSLEDVKKAYNFLFKQQGKYKPTQRNADGGPNAHTISWYANGGSAGLAWCRQVLREEGVLKSYTKEITQAELSTEDDTGLNHATIVKSVDDQLKQATFLAMSPDEPDLHGDITSEEEVRKAKENFNAYCTTCSLMHLVETNGFSVIESYITPADMILNDEFIKKGAWLMKLQFHNDELWQGVLDGNFNGISIGAVANVEYLEE